MSRRQRPARLIGWTLVAIALSIAALGTVRRFRHPPPPRPTYMAPIFPEPAGEAAARIRRELFAEIQPVQLANCELARFGEPNDGGYLMCANLLDTTTGGFSYGIAGYDQWGCDIARTRRVPVHQYDCFDPDRPACPGGDTRFHDECVAASAFADGNGRRFDTLERQIAAAGQPAGHVVLKIDVEGAEWDVFLRAPDAVLDRIDQIAVELHGTSDARNLEAVRRLKRYFHIAHLHFNNFSCWDGLEPFPAWAYELLLVNRRLAAVAETSRPAATSHPLDAPNNTRAPDCQTTGGHSPFSQK